MFYFSFYLCPACSVKCLLVDLHTDCILFWGTQRKMKAKLLGMHLNETRWLCAKLLCDANCKKKKNEKTAIFFMIFASFLSFSFPVCVASGVSEPNHHAGCLFTLIPLHLFTARRQGHLIFPFHRAISV